MSLHLIGFKVVFMRRDLIPVFNLFCVYTNIEFAYLGDLGLNMWEGQMHDNNILEKGE